MGIPLLPNGHWDAVALAAGVDAWLKRLHSENQKLAADRLDRHGFDCFATINPYKRNAVLGEAWPMADIVRYQVDNDIKVEG